MKTGWATTLQPSKLRLCVIDRWESLDEETRALMAQEIERAGLEAIVTRVTDGTCLSVAGAEQKS